jgi:hypothetical protein
MSNGFTHYRDNCPQWNPDYRVFADYEYFLQSLGYWGSETFQIYSQVLVNYVQRSNGVIGQSNYQDWVSELALLSQQQARYSCLLDQDEFLSGLIDRYLVKHQQGKVLSGFKT